jgi:hypothetical protein
MRAKAASGGVAQRLDRLATGLHHLGVGARVRCAPPGVDQVAVQAVREELAVEVHRGLDRFAVARIHQHRAGNAREDQVVGEVPIDHRVVQIGWVPFLAFRGIEHTHGVANPDLLEGGVPPQRRLAHRVPPLLGHRVIHVESDRLLRIRDLRRRIGLAQVEAAQHVAEQRILVVHVGIVLVGQRHATDALVRCAWAIAVVFQPVEVVVDGDLGAARVG